MLVLGLSSVTSRYNSPPGRLSFLPLPEASSPRKGAAGRIFWSSALSKDQYRETTQGHGRLGTESRLKSACGWRLLGAHRGPDGGTGPSQCLWVLSPGGCSEDAPSDFFLNSPQLSKDSLSLRLCIQVTMVTTLAAADTSWGRGHVSAVKNHML